MRKAIGFHGVAFFDGRLACDVEIFFKMRYDSRKTF